MDDFQSDPMLFRPPKLRRSLQFAVGLPLTAVVLLPTLFAPWIVWAPQGVDLHIANGVLRVTTGPAPFSRVRTIDLSSVTKVEETHVGKGHRVAGTALPGYCAGDYRYPDLGSVWVATDCSRDVVVLRLANAKPVLLTPPDRQAFLDALKSGREMHQTQSPPQTGVGWFAVKLLILLAPLTTLLLPVIFLVAPGRLRYHLEPGTLAVTTMLRTRRFAIAGATARPHRLKVGIKLWGTAAPGYYTGLFRADGANTKIYATSAKEGVLIKGADFRVFINPEKQVEFLEAYRSLGGAVD